MNPETLIKLRRLTRTLTASEANEVENLISEIAELKTRFASIINKKDKIILTAQRALNLIIGESTEIYIMTLARDANKRMRELE